MSFIQEKPEIVFVIFLLVAFVLVIVGFFLKKKAKGKAQNTPEYKSYNFFKMISIFVFVILFILFIYLVGPARTLEIIGEIFRAN
jgi:hypothetical protein